MAKERKFLRSIGFTEEQMDKIETLQEIEGGSFSEHVRFAVVDYLNKKKEILEK